MADPVQPERPRGRISDGSVLGDLTEAYHQIRTRKEKHDFLKAHPELQRFFRVDDFAEFETA